MSFGGTERSSDNAEREHFDISRMVVKIGSNALTEGGTKENPLNLNLIHDIARQCSYLIRNGVQVVIVSSGAVACGRYLLPIEEHGPKDRQIEAAFGQPTVIGTWVTAFKEHGIVAGQALITAQDLKAAEKVMREALVFGALIVNINDVVSAEALQGNFGLTDNDSTAYIAALAIEADRVAMLTNEDGVLDKNKNIVEDGSLADKLAHFGEISKKGTGGMTTKVKIMQNLASRGIGGAIARASRKDIILEIARNTAKDCTLFEAKSSPSTLLRTSNIARQDRLHRAGL